MFKRLPREQTSSAMTCGTLLPVNTSCSWLGSRNTSRPHLRPSQKLRHNPCSLPGRRKAGHRALPTDLNKLGAGEFWKPAAESPPFAICLRRDRKPFAIVQCLREILKCPTQNVHEPMNFKTHQCRRTCHEEPLRWK